MMTKLFLNERFVFVLILVNSCVLFLNGFDMGWLANKLFEFADHLFTVIFLVELLIKLRVMGGNKFFESAWNWLDFLVVLAGLPALYVYAFSIGGFDFTTLLVLRALRVFKFFRFLKFLPQFDTLMQGLRRALRASLVVLMTYFVFSFIISVLSFSIYKELSPAYFGDPVRSFYSIFKVFTIEGWYEIPDSIAEKMGTMGAFFTKVWFMLILIAGGLFGLSLVNSIFVDAMVSDNTDHLEKKIDNMQEELSQLRQFLEEREKQR